MRAVDLDSAERLSLAVSAFGPARNAARLVADLVADDDARDLLCTFVAATDIPGSRRPQALCDAWTLSVAAEDASEATPGQLRVLRSSDAEIVRFGVPIVFDNGSARSVELGMTIKRGHWRIAEFAEFPIV